VWGDSAYGGPCVVVCTVQHTPWTRGHCETLTWDCGSMYRCINP